jgi:hypothetical protein
MSITNIKTWRNYLDDKYIKNWIEIFEAIIEQFEDEVEDWELKDAIVDANYEMFKLNLITEKQEKYLEDTMDEDILLKIFLQVYKPHTPKKTYEEAYLKLFGSPYEILQLVDFCDKYIVDEPKPLGKVINETECVSTRYPELDVDCGCFRHKSHVVHGKWFWETN